MDNSDKVGNALCNAAFEGDLDTVKALIKAGVDMNFQKGGDGWTALHHAIENYKVHVVELLVNRGADVNVSEGLGGMTPLHLAIEVEVTVHEHAANNRIVTVEVTMTKLLIEHGANVHALDKRGESPLDVAIFYSHIDAQKLLREHGA